MTNMINAHATLTQNGMEDARFTTQPFNGSDAEYEAMVAINKVLYPETPHSAEVWKYHEQKRQAKYLFERRMVMRDDRLIGYYSFEEPHWVFEPGKLSVRITLAADVESPALRAAVWNDLLATSAEYPLTKLMIEAREDKQAEIDFLLARGFEQAMRFQESRLDLADFQPERFAAAREKTAASGLTVKPLSALMESDPDWARKLYDMDVAISADIPYPEPLQQPPFEVFIDKILNNPSFMPEGVFIGLDGDRFAGISGLFRSLADADFMFTGLTGVLREYRRRALATTMKLHALQFAKDNGAKFVTTDNEENNPMYQINLRLGFQPMPAWVEYRQTIETPEQRQALSALPT